MNVRNPLSATRLLGERRQQRPEPRHSRVPVPPAPGAEPAEDNPPPPAPQPSFTPREADPRTETAAQPALPEEEPVPPALPAPAIFDQMVAALPGEEPAPQAPPASAPPDLRPVVYTGPGWTAGMLPRLRELSEELDAMVERGYGRNVTDMIAGFRHTRQGIAHAARELCALLGEPGAEAALLRRTHAMVIEARRHTGPQQMPLRPGGAR